MGGSAAGVQYIAHQLRRTGTGFAHIDMRIVAIGGERGCGVAHLGADIGVKIEAGDNRRFGRQRGADAAEERPLAILKMLRHHGAVQIEIDGVGFCRGDVFQQHGGDALERVLRHMRRGRSGTPGKRQKLMARIVGRSDKSGERQVDSRHGVEQVIATG